jgi:hypothetical protein
MSLNVEGIVTNAVAVDLTGGDFTNPINGKCMVYCISDGTVNITLPSGITTSKDLVAGQYWKIRPITVLDTSTATIQLHY